MSEKNLKGKGGILRIVIIGTMHKILCPSVEEFC